MSKVKKLLEKIKNPDMDKNMKFSDLTNILISLGFTERINGDHHIFTKEKIAEIINIQPNGSKAKPYQLKQVREIIEKYSL